MLIEGYRREGMPLGVAKREVGVVRKEVGTARR